MQDVFDFINNTLTGKVDFNINFNSKETDYIDLCPYGWIKLWWLTQESPDFEYLDYIHYLYWNRYIDPDDIEIFWAIHNDELHKYIQTFGSGILKWKKYDTETIFRNIDTIKKITCPDTVLAMKAKISGLDFYKLIETNAREYFKWKKVRKNIIIQELWESIKAKTNNDPHFSGKIIIGYSGHAMYDDTMKVIIGFLAYLHWNDYLYIDTIEYFDYRCNITLSRMHNLTEDLFSKDHEWMINSLEIKKDWFYINNCLFVMDRSYVSWDFLFLLSEYLSLHHKKQCDIWDLSQFLVSRKEKYQKITLKNCGAENIRKNYKNAINEEFKSQYGFDLLDMQWSILSIENIIWKERVYPEEK